MHAGRGHGPEEVREHGGSCGVDVGGGTRSCGTEDVLVETEEPLARKGVARRGRLDADAVREVERGRCCGARARARRGRGGAVAGGGGVGAYMY